MTFWEFLVWVSEKEWWFVGILFLSFLASCFAIYKILALEHIINLLKDYCRGEKENKRVVKSLNISISDSIMVENKTDLLLERLNIFYEVKAENSYRKFKSSKLYLNPNSTNILFDEQEAKNIKSVEIFYKKDFLRIWVNFVFKLQKIFKQEFMYPSFIKIMSDNQKRKNSEIAANAKKEIKKSKNCYNKIWIGETCTNEDSEDLFIEIFYLGDLYFYEVSIKDYPNDCKSIYFQIDVRKDNNSTNKNFYHLDISKRTLNLIINKIIENTKEELEHYLNIINFSNQYVKLETKYIVEEIEVEFDFLENNDEIITKSIKDIFKVNDINLFE